MGNNKKVVDSLEMRLLKSEYLALEKVKQKRDQKTAPGRFSEFQTTNNNDNDLVDAEETRDAKKSSKSKTLSPVTRNLNKVEAQEKNWEDQITYCCDKCPKAYHPKCYIPMLKKEPPNDWQCLMCMNNSDFEAMPNTSRKPDLIGERDLNVCRRLMMDMYYQWPESSTFRSVQDLQFPLYLKSIKRPIALDAIKGRLERYKTVEEFVKDVLTMFKNCRTFWEGRGGDGVKYMKDARTLEAVFNKKLERYKLVLAIHDEKQEESDEKSPVKPPGPAFSKKLSKPTKKTESDEEVDQKA